MSPLIPAPCPAIACRPIIMLGQYEKFVVRGEETVLQERVGREPLAEFPERTWKRVGCLKNVVKRCHKIVDVVFCHYESRGHFEDVLIVAGHLA